MTQYDRGVNDTGLGEMLKGGFASFGERIKYVWNHPDANPDKSELPKELAPPPPAPKPNENSKKIK